MRRTTFTRGKNGGTETVDLVSTEELDQMRNKARFWQAMYTLGLILYLFTIGTSWSSTATTEQQQLTRLIESINCSYVPAGELHHEIAGKE